MERPFRDAPGQISNKRRRLHDVEAEHSTAPAAANTNFGFFAQFAFVESTPRRQPQQHGEASVDVAGSATCTSAPTSALAPSTSTKYSLSDSVSGCSGCDSAPSVDPGRPDASDLHKRLQPVIASDGGVWRERFSSVCHDCYRSAVQCPHYSEMPLRLLIIGHNPSDHTWSTGFPYSNPSNRFWRLLVDGGVLPAVVPHGIDPADKWTPAAANRLPDLLGIGITDMGCEPGSKADKYPRATMLRWRADLYARLRAHRRRAGRAPAVVAFTGVRQFSQLFDPPLKRLQRFGRQTIEGTSSRSCLPPGWPYLDSDTQVFVLPSSSGRAVFSSEERLAPYRELGEFLQASQQHQQPLSVARTEPSGAENIPDHRNGSEDESDHRQYTVP